VSITGPDPRKPVHTGPVTVFRPVLTGLYEDRSQSVPIGLSGFFSKSTVSCSRSVRDRIPSHPGVQSYSESLFVHVNALGVDFLRVNFGDHSRAPPLVCACQRTRGRLPSCPRRQSQPRPPPSPSFVHIMRGRFPLHPCRRSQPRPPLICAHQSMRGDVSCTHVDNHCRTESVCSSSPAAASTPFKLSSTIHYYCSRLAYVL